MKHFILSVFAVTSISSALAQPLTIQSVKQYECLINGTQGLIGYFLPHLPPQPIPYSNHPVIVCHDTSFGNVDREELPRRNEKLASFKVWDARNPLFFDMDGDGNLDVNNRIVHHARQLGGIYQPDSNFFKKLKVRIYELGFIMPHFTDEITFKSYCLSAKHYHSQNPLHKAISRVVAVDTEGLYAVERIKGDRDLLYVSESVIKRSWFYLKNNKPEIPNDQNISNVTVYFVHEGDVFRLKDPREMDHQYPAHDKKIGCVPKV